MSKGAAAFVVLVVAAVIGLMWEQYQRPIRLPPKDVVKVRGSGKDTLCRVVTNQCVDEGLVGLDESTAGPIEILLYPPSPGETECRAVPVGHWATPRIRTQLRDALSGFHGFREITVVTHRGEDATLHFLVPKGKQTCAYHAAIEKAPGAARVSMDTLCRPPSRHCAAAVQIGVIAARAPLDISAYSSSAPLCHVEPIGGWATAKVKTEIDDKLNRGGRGDQLVVPTDYAIVRFTVPDHRRRCEESAVVDVPGDAGAPDGAAVDHRPP